MLGTELRTQDPSAGGPFAEPYVLLCSCPPPNHFFVHPGSGVDTKATTRGQCPVPRVPTGTHLMSVVEGNCTVQRGLAPCMFPRLPGLPSSALPFLPLPSPPLPCPALPLLSCLALPCLCPALPSHPRSPPLSLSPLLWPALSSDDQHVWPALPASSGNLWGQ